MSNVAGMRAAGLSDSERDQRARQAVLAIRTAIWEACNYVRLPEIENYCAAVLEEIRSDEP